MKEVIYFLQWQWKRFETWQRWFLFAMFLLGCSLAVPEDIRSYFYLSGMFIVIGFSVKWIVWDGTKSAWQNYQNEKQKVMEILKDE